MFAGILGREQCGFVRCAMNGRQFIARVRRWARDRELEVRFVAAEGSGSHGTLYAGARRTIVKDRKKEIGKGCSPTLESRGTISKRQQCDGDARREVDLMPDTYNYPAEIECDEDGRYVVTFPDFGWGATDGATLEEALGEARDLLRELMATTMRESKRLPEPSRDGEQRYVVVPPVSIALKAALYEAFREAGMSQRRLARELEVAESEVRRMLNPDHATKAATIDRALRRLGKRVTVTIGAAA